MTLSFPALSRWTISVLLLLSLPMLVSAAPNAASTAEQFNALGIISLPGIVPAAEISLYDLSDKPFKVSDFKGKVVLLNLWATWCPDCTREMPALEKLQKTLGSDDFIVVAIDLREPKKRVEKFVRKHNLNFKILLDVEGKMGRAFGVRSIPTTFILGKNGGLLGKVMGARDWDNAAFVTLFQNLTRQD